MTPTTTNNAQHGAMQPFAVSIHEAVHLSRLSRTTIYRLIKRRELPHIKARGRTLIPTDALRNYLVAQTVSA